ncbi:MAG: malto-oligosyltrehalose trehalohydrolase [Desulfuromonadales bacterium]|nr:malto-oligosyltrehalose trehalohydrolase [Desulfuromonadales bacterium]
MQIGANYLGERRCEFVVWAPRVSDIAVKINAPDVRILPMTKLARGYWHLLAEEVLPGTDYFYQLDKVIERPDPASSYQPHGVHGPSRVIDQDAFKWTDQDWRGHVLSKLIIYELHVGTFTPAGTFAAVIPRLAELKALGITAIELMPVAQFPGERNWGYDGASPFAVQNSYGGLQGLKELVDACHNQGLSVILDVVYNHLGPEGNYLNNFGPYFTKRYRTPWGDAINFDGPGGDEVRNYFIENALYWLRQFHVDALRLDAIHGIYDFSAKPFLQELAEKVDSFADVQGRAFPLIAESDLNDARVINSIEQGGYGLDAQWNDDFHHALHTLLTNEKQGYYADFGAVEDLAKAYSEGFVYSWRYSAYRQRHHGSSSTDRPAKQMVVCSQNHDQVGNRTGGERLITLAGFDAAKLAAAAVLFSPYIPLLFMGEEYAEEAAFPFFVDFADVELQAAVSDGRKKELQSLNWSGEPPDPNALDTFLRAKLNWQARCQAKHRVMLDFYRELITLRRDLPPLALLDKQQLELSVTAGEKLIMMRRWHQHSQVLILFNFSHQELTFLFPDQPGNWGKLLDSAESRWAGPGSSLPAQAARAQKITMAPLSTALYSRDLLPEEYL